MSIPPSVPPPEEPRPEEPLPEESLPAEPRTPASPEEPPPPSAARGSKRYLGLPGWGIGLIVAGILLLCCLCVAGLCLSGPMFHRIGHVRSRAVVSVTRCDITPAGRVAR